MRRRRAKVRNPEVLVLFRRPSQAQEVGVAAKHVDPTHTVAVFRDAPQARITARLVSRLALRHERLGDVLLALLSRRGLVQVVVQRLKDVLNEDRPAVGPFNCHRQARPLGVADVHLRERGRLAHLAVKVLVGLLPRQLAERPDIADDKELERLRQIEVDPERTLALVGVVRT